MRELKYGEGSISELTRTHKDGTQTSYYKGRITLNGERKTVYANTKKECYTKLCALRKERDQAQQPPEQTPKQLNTYAAWLDTWFDTFKKDLRGDYAEELKKRVCGVKNVLGDKKLKQLTSMDIQHYLNTLPRRNTTVKIYDVINGSLQKAEDFGYIRRNPCRAVQRPTYHKAKRKPFELKEQCNIINILAPKYKRLFIFLCCTGLRIGEFLALQNKDIDWDKKVIHIKSAINSRTGTHSLTKTENGERDLIFEKSLFDNFNLNDYKDITYNAIKKAFEKAYNKLGLTDISVTHSCRHTFASIMHALGINDKILQKQMGHASITTTMDVYADVLMSGNSPILEYCRKLKAEIEHHLL